MDSKRVLEKEFMDKYHEFFKRKGSERIELKIRFGSKIKQIQFIEKVYAINDSEWQLYVYLNDENSIDWLDQQLKSHLEAVNYSEGFFQSIPIEWLGEHTFDSHRAICEYYGF